MSIISPISKDAYQLLHDGAIALARAEQRGMLVDVEYCKIQSEMLGKKINRAERLLGEDPEVKEWKKIYRGKFKLSSDEQLSDVLFNHLGYKSEKKTASGQNSTDKLALENLDSPMVKRILELRGFQKIKNTYIDGLLREQVNGVLRPSFSLNTVSTFRSSSQNPNFQNIPIRDPYYGKLIRRAFIPRPDHIFAEVDFAGIEVKVAACYHQDPVMLNYIRTGYDMHRDMAIQCYMLEKDQYTKDSRYCAKNKFVFPEFYGSYFKQVAPDLWNAIDQMNLATKSGIPLKEHLQKVGISNFAQFEAHIKEVENDFWNNRFKVYGKWKEKHYEDYQRNGYFDSLTGFRFQGYMKRNEVINYPVQGAAFHCLLKSFIEVDRRSIKHKWKSGLIGQIHDSLVPEIHKDEYSHVMDTIHEVMCEWVPKQWPWIIVPIEAEADVAPLGRSWYEKKEVLHSDECRECDSTWNYYVKPEKDGEFPYWKCPVCDSKREHVPF